MSDSTNKELLDALGVEVKVETRSTLTPKQERIIAGFEDINLFSRTWPPSFAWRG